jgi:hypothetical protein
VINVELYYLKSKSVRIPIYAHFNDGFYDIDSSYWVNMPNGWVKVDTDNIPHLINSPDQLMIGDNPNYPLIEKLVMIALSEGKLDIVNPDTIRLYVYNRQLFESQDVWFDPDDRNDWAICNPSKLDNPVDIKRVLINGYEHRNNS